MSNRKFFFPSLIGCAALALTLKWLAGRLSYASSAPGLNKLDQQNAGGLQAWIKRQVFRENDRFLSRSRSND